MKANGIKNGHWLIYAGVGGSGIGLLIDVAMDTFPLYLGVLMLTAELVAYLYLTLKFGKNIKG